MGCLSRPTMFLGRFAGERVFLPLSTNPPLLRVWQMVLGKDPVLPFLGVRVTCARRSRVHVPFWAMLPMLANASLTIIFNPRLSFSHLPSCSSLQRATTFPNLWAFGKSFISLLFIGLFVFADLCMWGSPFPPHAFWRRFLNVSFHSPHLVATDFVRLLI